MGLKQPAKPLWKDCAQSALQAELAGNFRSAEEHYRLSLTFATNSASATAEDVGEALINYADFLATQKRYRDAERYYRRALDVYNITFGEDNLITGMIYRVLADIATEQEQPTQAQMLHLKATDIMKEQRAS